MFSELLKPFAGQVAKPVNYYRRDPDLIESDVDYAIQVAESYLRFISELNLPLAGLNLCELGPGINFGSQLILASHGALVTIVDRFLAPWDDDYHPQFYRALKEKWRGPNKVLQTAVEINSYDGLLTTLEQPAEKLTGAQFDLVLSNAVLEHVYDPSSVCRGLSRITKRGGFNSHQIDLRDHRDFSKPFEFLLMDDAEFAKAAQEQNLQFGNRVRLSGWVSLFIENGFTIQHIYNDPPVDQDYLNGFIPRLRASNGTYKNAPIDDLKYGSNRIVLKKN